MLGKLFIEKDGDKLIVSNGYIRFGEIKKSIEKNGTKLLTVINKTKTYYFKEKNNILELVK